MALITAPVSCARSQDSLLSMSARKIHVVFSTTRPLDIKGGGKPCRKTRKTIAIGALAPGFADWATRAPPPQALILTNEFRVLVQKTCRQAVISVTPSISAHTPERSSDNFRATKSHSLYTLFMSISYFLFRRAWCNGCVIIPAMCVISRQYSIAFGN